MTTNLVEGLKKYSSFLSFMKIDTLSPSVVNGLLSTMNVNLDPSLIEYALNSIKALAKDKGYETFKQLITDKEIVDMISSLVDNAQEFSSKDQTKSGANFIVDKNAVGKCPHCNQPFALISILKD